MSAKPQANEFILVDRPDEMVCRVTLNRPDKRNAMNNRLRSELFSALEAADQDTSVRVIVLRGAGSCFSSGYELGSDLNMDRPFYTAGGDGSWSRHVVEGCFRIWDLSKPVIAQVHGYCLAGGSELAAACDLVYVADDALIGYPPVRSISPPDNQFFPWMLGMRQAMELMLTGDTITGSQAAQFGFANRAVPLEALDNTVLVVARRIAKIPSDIQQVNKRAVHRQMEAMGLRAGIRAGTELQSLALHSQSTQAWLKELRDNVSAALTSRDRGFGDYRTASKSPTD